MQAEDSAAAAVPSSGFLLGGMLNASFVQTFEPLAASVGWSGGRGEQWQPCLSIESESKRGTKARAECAATHAGHLTSGSLLASGMALAVLLLVLEGTLDAGRLVLGVFQVTPGAHIYSPSTHCMLPLAVRTCNWC